MDIDLVQSKMKLNGFSLVKEDSGEDFRGEFHVWKYLRGSLWMQVSHEYKRKYLSVGAETRKDLGFYCYYQESSVEQESEILELSIGKLTGFLNGMEEQCRTLLMNHHDDPSFIWTVLRDYPRENKISVDMNGVRRLSHRLDYVIGKWELNLNLRFEELELESYDLVILDRPEEILLKAFNISPAERCPKEELRRIFEELRREAGDELKDTDFTYRMS